jgi:hypothetical protein
MDGRTAMERVDHLIYLTTDLDAAVAELEQHLGVRAAAGGRHPRWGTRNALISLGETNYLEILAPDPDRPGPEMPTILGLDRLERSRLVSWAAKESDLGARVEAAARVGVELGEILPGSRERTDGTVLSWSLTDPEVALGDGLVPFLIDWGDSEHPALGAPRGCALLALRAEHPDPPRLRWMLEALALDLDVEVGSRPALIATIRTPMGETELR